MLPMYHWQFHCTHQTMNCAMSWCQSTKNTQSPCCWIPQAYLDKMPDTHRKVTVEYTMMDQINDRPEHAHQLVELMRDVPCKINLIPFNPIDQSDYKRVSNNSLHRFRIFCIGRATLSPFALPVETISPLPVANWRAR